MFLFLPYDSFLFVFIQNNIVDNFENSCDLFIIVLVFPRWLHSDVFHPVEFIGENCLPLCKLLLLGWTIDLLTLTMNKAKLYLYNTNGNKTNMGLDKSEKRQN